MIVTGWNNGSPRNTGAGYGVRVSNKDRGKYFEESWSSVTIEIDGDRIKVNVSSSFWQSCAELRSAKIGKWLIRKGLAPWPKDEPPKLKLEPKGNKEFILSRI